MEEGLEGSAGSLPVGGRTSQCARFHSLLFPDFLPWAQIKLMLRWKQKTHIKRNNLTSSVSVKEIEFIVKLGPHDFAHKLYQTLKEY